MVDTELGNIIKEERFLNPDILVDKDEILNLTGITAHHVTTLGLTQVDILGCSVIFHLVKNKFPIPEDGIIGFDFFNQFKVNVNYKSIRTE